MGRKMTEQDRVFAKKVGEVIANRRKALGWSQTKLANMAGMKQPTLSSIENGNHVPYFKTI